MGRTHVFSGWVAGTATLPLVSVSGTGEALGWVVLVGGAALIPDLDHHNAIATRMWGPVTRHLLHRPVRFLGRGHRGGSHDPIVAPVAFGALAYAATLHPISTAVVIALICGLTMRGCEFVIPGRTAETAIGNLLLSIAAAIAGGWLSGELTQALALLPYAIGLGVAVHIAGDAVTEGGIPKPFTSWTRKERFDGGPIGTGGRLEKFLIAPVFLAATLAGLYLFDPGIHQFVHTHLPARQPDAAQAGDPK